MSNLKQFAFLTGKQIEEIKNQTKNLQFQQREQQQQFLVQQIKNQIIQRYTQKLQNYNFLPQDRVQYILQKILQEQQRSQDKTFNYYVSGYSQKNDLIQKVQQSNLSQQNKEIIIEGIKNQTFSQQSAFTTRQLKKYQDLEIFDFQKEIEKYRFLDQEDIELILQKIQQSETVRQKQNQIRDYAQKKMQNRLQQEIQSQIKNMRRKLTEQVVTLENRKKAINISKQDKNKIDIKIKRLKEEYKQKLQEKRVKQKIIQPYLIENNTQIEEILKNIENIDFSKIAVDQARLTPYQIQQRKKLSNIVLEKIEKAAMFQVDQKMYVQFDTKDLTDELTDQQKQDLGFTLKQIFQQMPNLRLINKSQFGGNDEIFFENHLLRNVFFQPSRSNCFAKNILYHQNPEIYDLVSECIDSEEEMKKIKIDNADKWGMFIQDQELIFKFIAQNKINQEKFPMCRVKQFQSVFQIKICILKKDLQKNEYMVSPNYTSFDKCDIVLTLINKHFYTIYGQTVQEVKENAKLAEIYSNDVKKSFDISQKNELKLDLQTYPQKKEYQKQEKNKFLTDEEIKNLGIQLELFEDEEELDLKEIDWDCKKVEKKQDNNIFNQQCLENIYIIDLESESKFSKELQEKQDFKQTCYGLGYLDITINFNYFQRALVDLNIKDKNSDIYQVGESLKQQVFVIKKTEYSPCFLFFKEVSKKYINIYQEKYKKNNKTRRNFQIQIFAHNACRYDNHFFNIDYNENSHIYRENGIFLIQYGKRDDSSDLMPTFSQIIELDMIQKNGQQKKEKIYLYYTFKDTYKFITASLKQICQDFKIPKRFAKQNFEIQEIDLNNYRENNEWVEYLKNDVLSLSLIIFQFAKEIKEIFGKTIRQFQSCSHIAGNLMREQCGLPQPYKNKFFNTLNKYATKGGICQVTRQKFESNSFVLLKMFLKEKYNLTFNEFSKQLQKMYNDVKDDIYEKEKYMLAPKKKDLENIFIKQYEEEYRKQYPGLYEFVLENILKEEDYLVPYDANALYSSAMQIFKRFPKTENTRQITDQRECQDLLDYLQKNAQKNFDSETGSERLFLLKIDYLIPTDQNLLIMSSKVRTGSYYSNGYYRDQYCFSLDIENAIVCNKLKILKIHWAVEFQVTEESYFECLLKKFTEERNKDKDSVRGQIMKLMGNSCYGKLLQKTQKLMYVIHTVRNNQQDVICEESGKMNKEMHQLLKKVQNHSTQSAQLLNDQQFILIQKNEEDQKDYRFLGNAILGYSKRIVGRFFKSIDIFNKNFQHFYAQDTDSCYVNNKIVQQNNVFVGENLGQFKNDYSDNEKIIFGYFLMNKVKYCLTVKKGLLFQKYTFKGFQLRNHEKKIQLNYDIYEQLFLGNTVESNNILMKKCKDKVQNEVIVKKFSIVNKRIPADKNFIYKALYFDQYTQPENRAIYQ